MVGFVDVFTGNIVQPTDVSYNSITLTASVTQLQWPILATDQDAVAARITELKGSSGTPIVKLPDATAVSNGQDVLFRNTGTVALQVQTNTGAALLSLVPGEVKYIYLTDNTTVGGSWVVVAFGVSSSAIDASQLAGFGLHAIGLTLNTAVPVTSTSSSFTIQLSDRAHLYNFLGGAATLTLQSASVYGNDFFFSLVNNGSGAITIVPSGVSTIDGASSININPGESAIIVTDGINWFSLGRGRSAVFTFTQLVKNVAGNTDVVLTTSEASNRVLKFIGLLTGNINVIVPNVVNLYEIDNQTTGAFSLTVKTAAGAGVIIPQNNRNLVYSDGVNVLAAVTVSVSFTTFSDGSAAAPSISFTSDTDTGFYRAGLNTVGITAGGVTQMTISDTAIVSDKLDKNMIGWAVALG
jgi:hypothetical protein